MSAGPGANEIWLRGLRNPWRYSFDQATNRLWIGDVGQGRHEEVDRISTSQKGANLGWRRVEGYACYNPSSHCHKAGTVKPILAYSHAGGRCAITGGYVYRGSDIPALKGWYVFGDFCGGEIWAVSSTAGTHASKVLLRNTPYSISSFGEDATGELFVVDLGGHDLPDRPRLIPPPGWTGEPRLPAWPGMRRSGRSSGAACRRSRRSGGGRGSRSRTRGSTTRPR